MESFNLAFSIEPQVALQVEAGARLASLRLATLPSLRFCIASGFSIASNNSSKFTS
jgi:hypothetical protein